MPATIEELIALVLALQERVVRAEARADAAEARCAVLEAENARLRERVRELEARLGKDSSNSHKPPSSDSPYKARPPGKKGKRKVGGQPGHKGVTRSWVPLEKVTSRTVVRSPACVCGASLLGIPATTGTWARQVVEVPTLLPDVIEYVFETVRCPCCSRLNAPDVPPEAATCTGPNLTALAATLVGEYHLSRDAAASLLGSVLSLPICPATVQNCCEQVSAALEAATEEVAESLPASARVHMDETSWKQRKVLHWLWIAVSESVTSFAIHLRRGRHQLEAWFPTGFQGVVTCDRWRPYETFSRRQLCWSHLERDLQAIIDAGRAGTDPATKMMAGADDLFATWGRFGDGLLPRADLQRNTQAYRRTFRTFCARGASQRRDRKWRALGRDLLRQWDAVFRFLDEEGVEPTNNTAERGLRAAVLWRRGSQGTRTDEGSTFVERILTATANCRRQARSVRNFLADTLLAHRAGRPTPSLLPTRGYPAPG